ncbi:signal peptide containing protein [Cryptosporidium felis]|nr:signal peptide containing protein [Cryptosporidium felis]
MKANDSLVKVLLSVIILLKLYSREYFPYLSTISEKKIQRLINVSLIKASNKNDETDSNKSFSSISEESAFKVSVSDDTSDSSSINTDDQKAPKSKPMQKKLFSKSLPNLHTTGLGSRIRGIFRRKNKKKTHDRRGSEEAGTWEPEPGPSQENVGEGQADSDIQSPEIDTPPNPTLEKFGSADSSNYDLGIMTMYLESQVSSANSRIIKSQEILLQSKQIYRDIKSRYTTQFKESTCEEGLLGAIFILYQQLSVSKTYCETASVKIENESGYCRRRCKILNSAPCRTCREAFKKKSTCKSITTKISGMQETLEVIIKNCLLIKEQSQSTGRTFTYYSEVTPLKCTIEDLQRIIGKTEAKIFLLALKVSHINNLLKLKNVCNECVRKECMNCKSMSECPACPGLEDISACTECLAIQTLQSSHLLLRNELIREIKRLFYKAISCESYLALKSTTYDKAPKPTEAGIGKKLEEKVNLILQKFDNYSAHQHQVPEGAEAASGSQRYKTIHPDLKEAIITGVKLKTPTPTKYTPEKYPSQLSLTTSKIRKRAEEVGATGEEYQIPDKKPMESTPEERRLALLLFERGICTYLMLYMLEEQLKECNLKIKLLSSSHSGCEKCVSDGCRSKFCSNIPEVKAQIRERENISTSIADCLRMGFATQNDLKAKIEEIQNSGAIQQEISSTSSDISGGQGPSQDEDDSDPTQDEITRL